VPRLPALLGEAHCLEEGQQRGDAQRTRDNTVGRGGGEAEPGEQGKSGCSDVAREQLCPAIFNAERELALVMRQASDTAPTRTLSHTQGDNQGPLAHLNARAVVLRTYSSMLSMSGRIAAIIWARPVGVWTGEA
jgi:hypothetical protein